IDGALELEQLSGAALLDTIRTALRAHGFGYAGEGTVREAAARAAEAAVTRSCEEEVRAAVERIVREVARDVVPGIAERLIREEYPFGLLAVDRKDVARVHASSGTKGKPTVAAYTPDDLEVWREVMARVMTATGARRGDLLHVALGYGLFTGGFGFHDGAERI